MSDLPIVCTLTPDGLTDRLALIDALAADGVLARTPTASGIRLRNAAEMEFPSTSRLGVRGDAQRWLSTEATGTFPCHRSTDPDAVPLPLLDVAVA